MTVRTGFLYLSLRCLTPELLKVHSCATDIVHATMGCSHGADGDHSACALIAEWAKPRDYDSATATGEDMTPALMDHASVVLYEAAGAPDRYHIVTSAISHQIMKAPFHGNGTNQTCRPVGNGLWFPDVSYSPLSAETVVLKTWIQTNVFTEVDILIMPAYYEVKPLKTWSWRLVIVDFKKQSIQVCDPVDDTERSSTGYKRRATALRKVSWCIGFNEMAAV